jgi:hydroxypyruvate isomerase
MPPSISRRNALRSFAGAAALAAATRSTSSAVAQTPAAPTMPASPNPIRHSVCKWCFGKIPLEAFAKAVKEFGIESVELLDPKDWPTVQKLGLTCALATGTTTIPVGFNRIENHAKYVASMTERINAVADAGLPSVIVFSGNRTDKAGVTVSDEQGIENCAIGLKQIMGVAEKRGVNVIMELLNSKVNHKDYMCDRTPWGVELVKRVGSERFKLLYDIYHMQIMEGDVIRTIQENHQYIGHYHTAGNPGRAEFEPGDQQELYYPPIMRAIAATGFKGFVAQEFIPKRDPLTSLRAAVKLCTV